MAKERSPYSNNIYVPTEQRIVLENMAVRAGVLVGRTFSASRFIRYLIDNFSEQALDKISTDGKIK